MIIERKAPYERKPEEITIKIIATPNKVNKATDIILNQFDLVKSSRLIPDIHNDGYFFRFITVIDVTGGETE